MEGPGSSLMPCDVCGKEWKARGLARHRKACQKERDEREARDKYLEQKKEKGKR